MDIMFHSSMAKCFIVDMSVTHLTRKCYLTLQQTDFQLFFFVFVLGVCSTY